jgi:putative hemolysin
MGIYSLNTMRLNLLADRGNHAAQRLRPYMERYEALVSSTLIGTNIGDYAASAFVTAGLLHLSVGAHQAELYATAIVTPLILVFGNIVPKERFRVATDQWMYPLAWFLVGWTRITQWTGLPAGLSWLGRRLLAWLDPGRAAQEKDLLPRARMLRGLREGIERGGLSDLQRDTFERVMRLSGVRVNSVMVPHQRAAMIPESISRGDFLRIARMAHFSRLPVYRRNPRKVIGVVHVFDVLSDPEQHPVKEHVRPVHQLKPSDPVPLALRQMQVAGQTIAIINNTHGQCIGLLTIKDLVEEIVGEIEEW